MARPCYCRAGREGTLFTQDERAVFDHGELGDDTPSGAEAPQI